MQKLCPLGTELDIQGIGKTTTVYTPKYSEYLVRAYPHNTTITIF